MSATHVSAELRRLVAQRAAHRCEYCLIPQAVTLAPHEIDHLISEKHGGSTGEGNLALSCTLCNRFKGSDISSIDPLSGQVVALFHPRRDQWSNHFRNREGYIEPLTTTGRVTVNLLQLNHPDRVAERRLLVQAGVISQRSE